MNVLFLLTPKENVSYVSESDTMLQVLDAMEEHGYTAVPLLSRDGKYIGTLTEGDLLWTLKDKEISSRKQLAEMAAIQIRRRRDNQAVNVQAKMDDLFQMIVNQNFVPVVDDNKVFIGIVTRKDLLLYFGKLAREAEESKKK